jgi:hypothetical protein
LSGIAQNSFIIRTGTPDTGIAIFIVGRVTRILISALVYDDKTGWIHGILNNQGIVLARRSIITREPLRSDRRLIQRHAKTHMRVGIGISITTPNTGISFSIHGCLARILVGTLRQTCHDARGIPWRRRFYLIVMTRQ